MQKIKEYLKNTQPIVYQTLKNAFINHKTTHAYLINGTKGSFVLPIAEFLAQSFICQQTTVDGLACEDCIDCIKIKEKNFVDYIFINGEDLKNDQVLNIQKEFNKSAIEKQNIKIYVISLIEKAPVASLNKLLKFIEEPSSLIIAIFTTHSLSSILPTITSRCQIITLKQFSHQEIVDQMLQNHSLLEDAHLLACVSNDIQSNLEIVQSEEYEEVKKMIQESLVYLANNKDNYIFYMQTEGFSKLDKNNQIDFYLDLLEACFFETMVSYHNQKEPRFFKKEIQNLQFLNEKIEHKIKAIMIAKQELLSNANKQLVLDKLLITLTDGDHNG